MTFKVASNAFVFMAWVEKNTGHRFYNRFCLSDFNLPHAPVKSTFLFLLVSNLPGDTWAMDSVDVTALTLSDLFALLHLVVGEMQRRCVNFQSSPVPRPPPGPPAPSSSEEPQPCGEQCKYCTLPCGRSKLGHTYSCYQHKDRRD